MMWQLPFLSLHVSLKQKGDSSTLSLFFNCKNLAIEKSLVKTSATWSIEGTKRISNVFCKTLSRTKCMSISICFVREWYTWLAASEAAPWLSYQITGENLSSTPNYLSKECIQVNSTATRANARYSDSILDRATTLCFLELQDTRFPPKNTQQPLVDSLSFG